MMIYKIQIIRMINKTSQNYQKNKENFLENSNNKLVIIKNHNLLYQY